jgi:transcriptional regulator with XRE-family HTH domain
MTFGECLTQLRKEFGMTQDELAKELGITRGSLSMYETDKRFPDKDILKSIADFFSVSTDYLLGRTEFRTPADRISEAIGTDKELLTFWEDTRNRENVQLLFKQIRNLSDRDINQVIKIIKAIEDEEANE